MNAGRPRRRDGSANLADTVARMHAAAREIDALYALRAAAEEAIRLDDFGPIKRALMNLSIAEGVRRGTP